MPDRPFNPRWPPTLLRTLIVAAGIIIGPLAALATPTAVPVWELAFFAFALVVYLPVDAGFHLRSWPNRGRGALLATVFPPAAVRTLDQPNRTG
ncbi:MAG: hypothetical protein U0556_08015 [Dehalococcoidia bacterium]